MRAPGFSGPAARVLLWLWVLPAFPAAALEVHVAPLAVVEDRESLQAGAGRPEADLLRELRRESPGDGLAFREADAGASPTSLLEAAALCERNGYTCLLYGYVRRTEVSLSAELKLLDPAGGRLAAVFFGGDDPAHYDRLMRDLAAKVREYFLSEMGLPPVRTPEPRRNRLELAGWLGYWTPAGGEWDRVLAGIAAAGLGARLIPSDPLFRLRSRSGYLALGLEAEYGLGMNEPGYESFFLHAVKLRTTLEAVLDLPAGHAAGLGLGMLAELDTAAQDRKYASLFTGTTLAPGFCLSVLYRYRLTGRLTLGTAMLLEVVAYSPALVTFSPRLFAAFSKGEPDESPRP
jgi:hypothetical protein